jgi:hypothetical protein
MGRDTGTGPSTPAECSAVAIDMRTCWVPTDDPAGKEHRVRGAAGPIRLTKER